MEKNSEHASTELSASNSLLKTTFGFRGETTCIVVYSDKTHVDYIYPLLEQLDVVLKKNGFEPKRLGDEIRSSEDYLEKLETMANNCSLGLIILDGFRPNVLFEFGYLKAKRKPIIILQSKDAFINIKTLFREIGSSGLTPAAFERLCNPKVDVAFHLSDFAGKHISKMDWRTQDKDPLHPSRVLLTEINKKKKEVIDETIRLKTKNLSEIQEKELFKPIIEVISLYHSKEITIPIKDIKKSYSSIKDIISAKNLKPPIEIYQMIISIYKKKIIKTKRVSDVISCLDNIQEINNEILNSIPIKKNEELFANSLMNKAFISLKLFKYSNNKELIYEAINTFKKALKIYKRKQMNSEYVRAVNMIGTAYSELSEIEKPVVNCKKAIQMFNKSLKILAPDEVSFEYVETQFDRGVAYFNLGRTNFKIENVKEVIVQFEKLLKLGALRLLAYQLYGNIQGLLGASYGKMAKLENKKEMYPRAFEAFNEALKYTSLQKSPVAYAVIQNNLGVDYGELARLENKAENCKKAIFAFNEALKVYTYEQFPLDNAFANTNLCEIYRILAETEDRVINCNNAIEACKKALTRKIFKINSSEYARSLRNLGSVYSTLAEEIDPADNYGKAIIAFKRALTIGESRPPLDELALTKKNLGEAYHKLFKTSSKASDYRNAIKEYKQALKIYVKLDDKKNIDLLKKSFGDLSELHKNL